MSPKKVNKDEKRREIAIACYDLIHDIRMKNITVAQVAKAAGIGKGTVYEYFENKDDIIFEIINMHIEKQHSELIEKLINTKTTRKKVELFFDVILNETTENLKRFNGYKEFLSIVLSEENYSMKQFNCNKNEFFRDELKKIFNEGIQRGELKKESIDLADGILTYQKGLALRKMSQNNFDYKKDFEIFMNTIFNLIEIKK